MLQTTHLHIERCRNECEMATEIKSGLTFLLLTLS